MKCMGGVAAAWVLAALGGHTPVAAQTAGATPVVFGESVLDTLVPSGDTLQDGSFFKSFMLGGQTGDTISLTVSSIDFDANLVLMDAEESILAVDDNGDGRCNAHINAILPSTGLFYAIVLSANPHEIGGFRLSLNRGRHPPSSGEPCRGFAGPQGIIAVGDTILGAIGFDAPVLPADSTFYQVWVLAPSGEDTVTVDLFSRDFDATLFLVVGIDEVVDANDDGAGGCNSRLVFAPSDGRARRIVVRPSAAGLIGTYALRAVPGALPVVTNSQCNAHQDSVP